MVLLPFFDTPSGFQLGKITEECPFQGPVFFGLVHSVAQILTGNYVMLCAGHGTILRGGHANLT